MTRFTVVVVGSGPARAAALAERLEAQPRTRLAAVVHDAASLRAAVADERPALVVAELAGEAFAMLETLPEPRPPLLVCGAADDAAAVLRAMRLGAREVVPDGAAPELLAAALDRLLSTAAPPREPARGPAALIAWVGSKGGVGATVLASQLAVVLQALSGRTALVDLVLPVGDAALHLDVEPGTSLAGAPCDATALDATLLRSLLVPHRSGVQVLTAAARPEHGELLAATRVEQALALLRREFDYVVADLGRGWSEAGLRALDAADHVLLVTQADVPSLVNARRQLELLERLGVAPERIHLVENRHGRPDAVPDRDLRRFLARPIELRLPEDAALGSCANDGRMLSELAPYGHAQRALVGLARQIAVWCGREEEPLPRASLLERVRLGLGRRGYGAA